MDANNIEVFVPQSYCGHPVRGPLKSKAAFDGAFDSYVILIKNTPLGISLLESWAQSKYYCNSAKKWPEQTRLFMVLGRMLMQYHKEPVTSKNDCSVGCTNNPEDYYNSTGRLMKCLKETWKRHGHRQGHDGAFGYPPDPPIAWSNGACGTEAPGTDVGLGFNLNLHSNFREAPLLVWNASGIHFKPGGFSASINRQWQVPEYHLEDGSVATPALLEANNRETGGGDVDKCFDELKGMSEQEVLKLQAKQFEKMNSLRKERETRAHTVRLNHEGYINTGSYDLAR
jgi:hypothetical protein